MSQVRKICPTDSVSLYYVADPLSFVDSWSHNDMINLE